MIEIDSYDEYIYEVLKEKIDLGVKIGKRI